MRPRLSGKRYLFTCFVFFFAIGCSATRREESSERFKKLARQDPPTVDVANLKTLSSIIQELATKQIVYVGEEHDKFSHHLVQLEILRTLHRDNPKTAVGMEMFERPFQRAVDDYVGGAVDERAFLKRSEYFKRWNIDYHLYKPILDYARDKRLPVVALNARREIVDKVAKSGLDALSKAERNEIPANLDFSDQEYRARLKEIFAEHKGSGEKNFEFFYQAQILWDETMAESIDQFLKKNPDYRMIVLAGSGHLQYASGIPKRSFRRNGFSYGVVLNDAEIKPRIADFIVFPEAVAVPSTPKIGVVVEEQNQQLRVKGFAKESLAEKAGFKAGDILESIDGERLSSSDDLQIALFYKKAGETVTIRGRRAEQELEFRIKLP